MWFDRRSVADRALVARHTKRKQEAEAEHDAPPQGRMTLELRAGSVVDDAPEERPFGRSLRASLGPAWAALHTTARERHGASRNDAIKGRPNFVRVHLLELTLSPRRWQSDQRRGRPVGVP